MADDGSYQSVLGGPMRRLLAAIAPCDDRAFSAFYRRHPGMVVGRCAGSADLQLAADLTAEVLFVVERAPKSYGLATVSVANHASRVRPADACFRDCIGAAWQPLTVAPMLRPRRNVCAAPVAPGHPREGGQAPDRTAALMLCLWKQRCCTSTPTSSCTDSRTAPAMERSRARRRDECSSSKAAVGVGSNAASTGSSLPGRAVTLSETIA